MPNETTRIVRISGERVSYTVRRSERAVRARIVVDLDGVTVVLPSASRLDPDRLLRDHADWVLRKHAQAGKRRSEIPERRFEPGGTFPYLGERCEVVVEQRSRSAVEGGRLVLAAHHVDQTSVRRALECLYRRVARERFANLLAEHAPALGVEDWRLEVRNQRTKWGSCSSSGTISLNWRLVMAPAAISRYVVCHELVHRRVPNHGDAFWAELRRLDPACDEHAAWLDDHGHRLVFTKTDM